MLDLTLDAIRELIKRYWKEPVPNQPAQPTQPTQPALPAASSYSVRQGDTLYTIATATLGDGARWKEIWELNKDQITDPNRIFAGMVLKMPGASGTPASPPVEPQGSGPVLAQDAKGEAVSKLQARLQELGFDPGGVDGIMGPNTVAAVKNFQASKGLEADGIVGPNTWKQLGITVDVNSVAPPPAEGSGPLIKDGARGDAVGKLQARLQELGFDPGGVDGIMGPNTIAAVKNFQASKGLEADGVVGPDTWKQLGITVDSPVDYPSGSNDLIDMGDGQPAVMRKGMLIGSSLAAQFDAMDAAAKADGIDLQIESGYRSHAEQQALWDENPDPTYVAYPGTSNHETGNAIDFSNTPGAWDWLAEHAPEFGLYNYDPEPWHYSVDGG